MINLFDYQDLFYLEFNSKIVYNTHFKYIGIRIPKLKEIAKNMVKNDEYMEFLNEKHEYFEEVMIHGLILGYIKESLDLVLKYVDKFVPLIDNWQVNDTVAANLKCFKKNQQQGFNYISKLLNGNSWSTRFGLVLLLDHYLNDNYIDIILDICLNTKSNNYYVNMANSWLISMCYIKYPQKTIKLIKNSKLDTWVLNKSISKICDSYRVSTNDKEFLKKYRR